MCLNNACLTSVPNPAAAFAAKYCAVKEHVSPIIASKSKAPPIFRT